MISSKAFYLVPHGRLLTKIAATRVDFRVVVWIQEFLLGRSQREQTGATISGSQSNLRSAARERIRSSTVSSLC